MFNNSKIHKNIPLLFIIKICRAFCINLIWTTWPLYVRSLGASVSETSYVWTISGAVCTILVIPFSIFSDRFGRKIAITLSFVFTIISHFAFTQATIWEQLIPLKILANLEWVFYFPADAAVIADISDPSMRGRLYGFIGSAHPIGSIVAPVVDGLILDDYGWNAVFYSILFSAAIGLIPCLLLKETSKKQTVSQYKPTTSSLSEEARSKNKIYLYNITIFSLFNFFVGIHGALSQVTPIYLKDNFNASSFQQGLFFSVGTMVPSLLIQIFGGLAADRYDRKKLILSSCLSWPLLMLLWPHVNSYNYLLALQLIINLTLFSTPAFQAYIMEFSDTSKRGLTSGVSTLGQRIGGNVVGNQMMGYLYERYDKSIPFYAAALFSLPSIPVLMVLREYKKDKTTTEST